jgi:hypothetical protein
VLEVLVQGVEGDIDHFIDVVLYDKVVKSIKGYEVGIYQLIDVDKPLTDKSKIIPGCVIGNHEIREEYREKFYEYRNLLANYTETIEYKRLEMAEEEFNYMWSNRPFKVERLILDTVREEQ